jgi:hypothetical protein
LAVLKPTTVASIVFGLPGSNSMSVTLRLPALTVFVVSFWKVALAEVALVER